MSGITYDYMDSFIKGLITEHDGSLKELEDYAHLNSVPIVLKEVARFLELMITIKKPETILELGTAIGYSSILMNEASGGNSHITTIERDENMVKLALENIEKYNKKNKIEILQGECLDILQSLN